MRRSALVAVATLSLLCALWVPCAVGQAVYGSILGTVSDPSGAAVAGAKVTVTSQTKNVSVTDVTNDSGNYSVTHLIPDVYSVRIEGTGFKTIQYKDIQVSADTGSRVDGQFQVGSASEQVEVTAEAPQLKTDRADVSIEFNSKYVTDLPVLNRNFTTFELLSPGTQKLVGWSHAATENPQGGQQIFVNGQHFSGTAFELDGTDNQDPILGIIVVNPNLEAITETKIALQNYDAEFGKAVAGVVTVQTKSGTNDLHGSAFWFRRTDALAARDPFTQFQKDANTGRFIPSSRWQQFGGTIGGPIIKNKLFFFGDYQATRQTSGITNQYTIPTLTALTSCNPATNATSSTPGFCNLADYASKIGNGTAGDPTNYLFDPTTGDPNNGTGRLAFCGATEVANPSPLNCATPFLIPITAIPTQVGSILGLLPAPNNSNLLNNFIAGGAGPFKQNSFDTRIDYSASQSLNVFGRFSLDYFNLSGKGGLGVMGGAGFGPGGLAGSSTVHNISLATGFTKTVSASLLTDFRFGYFKYNPEARKPDAGTPMTDLGIPGMNRPEQAAATAGLASFFFDGVLSPFGDGLNVARCNCPLTENEHQYQFVNNWTKMQGNHQFKFGADFRFAHNLRVPSDANRTGELNFSHQATSNGGAGGLDLATFLLGDVTHLNRYVSTSLDAAESQKRFAFYGQDTWRVTSKLTFNYGLRWEIYTPEAVNGKDKGGFANIVGTGDNGGGVIRVAGEGPYNLSGNVDNKFTAFAPRLGLAYQINPKTVVRMGYGRSFDIGVFGSNFGHTVTQNLPVLVNQSISVSNLPGRSNASDNLLPVFALAQGPPAYIFPTQFVNGQLPLEGPANNTDPKIRPTFQRLPTIDAWNLTVQRQLNNTTSLEVAYIGNKGTHVFAGDGPGYNVNPVALGSGTDVNGSFVPDVAPALRRPFNGRFSTPCTDVTCTAPVVVCCGNDLGNYLGNDASSSYNALQVKVDKRFTKGLQFLTHYTFAHSNKYDSNYYAISHPIAYGPDDQTRNHVWVTNIVYELPFGRGKTFAGNTSRLVDAVIGGWQITNTTNWSSGLPWTPSFGECGGEEDVGVCRPNRGSGSFHMGAGKFDPIQHITPFFTPVANITTASGGPFADPGVGHLGNYGVFSLRGPRAFTSDAAVSKNFSITERVKAQFRMDVFNLFNHPVLGFNGNQSGSGQCIDCAGNGNITDIEADSSPGSTTGMRQLEFALKVSF
ncbi:MAG TPA: TonB-dependent receptor [Candidatus Sulfotelmatobacter sp.]|nr:TonB-dependent receptor [Candidatus Sulfotelmatobacter sp.]